MSVSKQHFLLLKKIHSILSGFGAGLPVIFNNHLIFSGEFFDSEIFDVFGIDFSKNKLSLAITEKRAKFSNLDIGDNHYLKLICEVSDIRKIISNAILLDNIKTDVLNKDELDCAELGIGLMKLAKFLPFIVFHKIDTNKKNELISDFGINVIYNSEFDEYTKIKFDFVEEVCRATVALKNAENSEIVVFRDFPFFGKTHLAIIIGDYNSQKIPTIRVHSGCYTGDLLRSLQCDCYEQLHSTLELLSEIWTEEKRFGVIIYQSEDEGRAIGLANKIRTYDLQNSNCNTISANHAIGYEDDERDFVVAMKILDKLKISECDLITNNPNKLDCFREHNVLVRNRISLGIKNNLYNENYLNIKKEQMGHLFSD